MSNNNSRTKKNLFFFALLCVVISYGLKSQETSTTDLSSEVGSIEVIGTRKLESGLIEAPVKVEALTEEYLKKQQYQDLAQGISDVPGVLTTETSRRAGSKSALIQGFGENSVLVMIDGTPVSQNSSFGFDLSQISTADIERVEVIKGGASALYGSQAIGGVINIVTKKPENKTNVSLEASSATQTAGEEGRTRNVQLNSAGRFKGLGTKLTLSYRDQQAYDLNPASITEEGVAYEKLHSSLYLDSDIGGVTVFANYILLKGLMTSKTSRPYSSSAFGATINETDSITHNIKVGTESKLAKGKLRTVLNWEKTQDDLRLNDNPDTPWSETFKETTSEGRRLDLLYKDITYGSHSFTVGALLKENIVNQETTSQAVERIVVKTTDIDDRKIRSYELFGQDTFYWKSFEISPGVRYQYDNNFGSYAAPKVNVSHYYERPSISFKSWLSVGTGYRAPTVKERFFTLDHSSVANYIVVGNENLTPEKSLSFQLGEELKWGQGHSLYGNVFLNSVRNLIDTVEQETGNSSRLFTYQNIDQVISRGVEVGLKSRFSSKWFFRVNGSYTEVINQSTNMILANRPLFAGMVSTNYSPTDRSTIIAMGRFTGSKYTDMENTTVSPGFSTLDLKVNFKLDNEVTLFSSLNNVFDTTRDPAVDSVTPIIDDRPNRGREIFLGLKMEVL